MLQLLHGRSTAEGPATWIIILVAFFASTLSAIAADDPSSLPERLAWQIALDREGFSPGLVDGKIGAKTRTATEEFQSARGLPQTGQLDAATINALKVDPDTAITEHLVEASDLRGITPFTNDWIERASQDRMGYYSPLDGLAERFHTSKALMQSLNPSVSFDGLSPGTPLRVPAVLEPVSMRAASLSVDLQRKLIFALDAAGRPIAMFHCSIAAKAEKRPSGQTRVIVVVQSPDYTFDPESWPEVREVTRKLRIPPGPRNPVGLAWIGLDLPGYGMHGTPQPEMIGKSGSHGCFRMANWDAIRLAKMVRVGTLVSFAGDDG